MIDPRLQMPTDLLVPLEQGQSEKDRPNLALSSMNASVNASVWVLSGVNEDAVRCDLGRAKERVVIDVKSHNAAATVKLVRSMNLESRPIDSSYADKHGLSSECRPPPPTRQSQSFLSQRRSDARITLQFHRSTDDRLEKRGCEHLRQD